MQATAAQKQHLRAVVGEQMAGDLNADTAQTTGQNVETAGGELRDAQSPIGTVDWDQAGHQSATPAVGSVRISGIAVDFVNDALCIAAAVADLQVQMVTT
jgi:hypothetical protein